MEYDVYFDESGDLGWKLNLPYRKGGSSQFFTIAYIIIPTEKNKHINRFIKKFHKDRNGKEKEVKGADFRNYRAKSIARNMMTRLLDWNNDITIGAVTTKKANVPPRLMNPNNHNVLYDHMVKVGLCSKLVNLKKVNIIPDKRSVPSGSQNSCADLLKNELWLNLGSQVELNYQPEESHQNERLIFIDWVANFVWRNYENGSVGAYQILSQKLQEDYLFF